MNLHDDEYNVSQGITLPLKPNQVDNDAGELNDRWYRRQQTEALFFPTERKESELEIVCLIYATLLVAFPRAVYLALFYSLSILTKFVVVSTEYKN